MEIGVVGAGIVGLSIARALRVAGHDVTIYDQGPVPNPLASSVDRSRLIRHAYGAQPGYAAMVDDAYAAWERLWQAWDRRLYHPTGTLVLAKEGSTWARECAATLERIGQPYDWLAPEDAEARFPLLDLTGIAEVCHLDTGGVLFAEKIVAALAEELRTLGGKVYAYTPVGEVDSATGTLRLDGGRQVGFDLLVLAPGPWAGRLLPELAPRLTPSRQLVTYGEVPEEDRAAWAEMPMVLDIGKDSGFYAVPPVADQPLKIGDHAFTLTGDPDRARDPGAEEMQAMFDSAAGRIRGFERCRLLDGRTCFYTVAEAERFVVEPRGRAFVFAGFSGHGFKFGPLIGERFVEMLSGGLTVDRFVHWLEGRDT